MDVDLSFYPIILTTNKALFNYNHLMALAKTVFVKLERHLTGAKPALPTLYTKKKNVDAVVTVKLLFYES